MGYFKDKDIDRQHTDDMHEYLYNVYCNYCDNPFTTIMGEMALDHLINMYWGAIANNNGSEYIFETELATYYRHAK